MTRLFNKPNVKFRRSQLRKNATDAEKKLWFHLRSKQLLGLRFLRQYSIGKYITDFCCPKKKLIIELDGSQHINLSHVNYDEKRANYFNSLGFTIIRFWDSDVLKNTRGVLEQIANKLTPPDLPFEKGEEKLRSLP